LPFGVADFSTFLPEILKNVEPSGMIIGVSLMHSQKDKPS
jgi:hypothetical protein